MVYYQDSDLVIRDLIPSDARAFTDGEIAQGWHADIAKYETRLRDREAGKCVSLAAEWRGEPAGYVNVYIDSVWGPFMGKGLPEIVDFGVLQKFQRRGIGGRLMDAAEQVAARYADAVYLAVGLHEGYGSAQRMYVRRGYIPDGSGAWYGSKPCVPYEKEYPVDDDLVLYLSKRLK